jgi:hypothetical protein
MWQSTTQSPPRSCYLHILRLREHVIHVDGGPHIGVQRQRARPLLRFLQRSSRPRPGAPVRRLATITSQR